MVYAYPYFLAIAPWVGVICLRFLRQRGWPKEPRSLRQSFLLSALFGLLIPALPYLRVELLTALFQMQLQTAVQGAVATEYGKGCRILMVKVMGYRGHVASVYVVSVSYDSEFRDLCSRNSSAVGDVLGFTRSGAGWAYSGSDLKVWSDCGNGSDSIFPPYPGQGDFNY